jgi:hypothetical protein
VRLGNLILSFALVIALNSQAAGQTAILQIRMVEGEGTVHAPGSRSARPLTVEVTDDTGKPVEGAAVSFHLPEAGPGGTFPNGLRTAVVTTDAHGRASVRGIQANRIPGRFQIRIVASKEQARAGMVSFQYVGEGRGAAAPAPTASAAPRPVSQPAAKSGRHTGRWIAIAVLVGGAAAAGLIAGHSGSSSGTPPTAPPPAAPTIGQPTIVVGRP